jgi:hypothetical protein
MQAEAAPPTATTPVTGRKLRKTYAQVTGEPQARTYPTKSHQTKKHVAIVQVREILRGRDGKLPPNEPPRVNILRALQAQWPVGGYNINITWLRHSHNYRIEFQNEDDFEIACTLEYVLNGEAFMLTPFSPIFLSVCFHGVDQLFNITPDAITNTLRPYGTVLEIKHGGTWWTQNDREYFARNGQLYVKLKPKTTQTKLPNKLTLKPNDCTELTCHVTTRQTFHNTFKKDTYTTRATTQPINFVGCRLGARTWPQKTKQTSPTPSTAPLTPHNHDAVQKTPMTTEIPTKTPTVQPHATTLTTPKTTKTKTTVHRPVSRPQTQDKTTAEDEAAATMDIATAPPVVPLAPDVATHNAPSDRAVAEEVVVARRVFNSSTDSNDSVASHNKSDADYLRTMVLSSDSSDTDNDFGVPLKAVRRSTPGEADGFYVTSPPAMDSPIANTSAGLNIARCETIMEEEAKPPDTSPAVTRSKNMSQ